MADKHSEKETTKYNKKDGKNKKNKGLRIFLVFIIIIVLLLVGVLGGAFWYINDKLGKMQQVEIKEEELNIDEKVEEKLTGYRNIAIFGVDSRNPDDLGRGNRSDCIIIASINQETCDIKLVSVYRDTYVQIQGYGLDKITHAYSYGEAPVALNTLNTNFDLNIKEFVTVNFDSVAEAVDLLGGVDIDVEQNEIKYLNSYLNGTAKATGKTAVPITHAGLQTLNGVQAVSYGRIRYTEGGDYKRTERMRDVIEAMLKKLKTKSIGEINNILDQILPKVYTNMTTMDFISMIPNVMKYNVKESIGWPYNTKGITLDRWYGVPVTLESNVIQMHQELFGEVDYTPSETVQTISNKIINKTGYR